MSYSINLSKETFKFSGCHFTILGPREAERLHGHNYYVRCQLKVKNVDEKLGMAFDFNAIKPKVKKLCDDLDEFVLIPENSPYLEIKKEKSQLVVRFDKKTYVFPMEDVRLLPLVNITSEELARYLTEKLCDDLEVQGAISTLSINVRETRGQDVTFKKKL